MRQRTSICLAPGSRWISLAPSEKAVENGAQAIAPAAMDWVGLALVSIVLPAILTWAIGLLLRRIGWIKKDDLKLPGM